MKLDELKVIDDIISELIPPVPSNMTQQGATTLAPGQQVTDDPQAQRKMQAQQALDKQNQKRAIQDAIRQKQEELNDLRKQLAQIK